jgi:adenosylmethionine-8-amino-7-oxononanoate aminotransferase
VLCTTEVAQGVSAGEAGGLMHGPTFMANPLACAIASASLDLLAPATRRPRSPGMEGGLRRDWSAAYLASVADVRVLGSRRGHRAARARPGRRGDRGGARGGVWVRPFRNLVYTMPPYVSEPDEVAQICSALVGAVRSVHP